MQKCLTLQVLSCINTGSNYSKLISSQKLPLTECILVLPALSLLGKNTHFFYVFHGRHRFYTTGSKFTCIFKSLQDTFLKKKNSDSQDKTQGNYITSFGLASRYFTSLWYTVFCCQNKGNSYFSVKVNLMLSLLSLYISMVIQSIKA